MGKVKNWTVEKKDEIETILIDMWASLGMEIPDNYEDIVQDCYEDVCETADPINWNNSDVVIAFRRWIEAQAKENVRPNFEPAMEDKFTETTPMSEPHIGLDGIYGVKLNTVGDLRNAMSELNDEDQLVLATCDEHGDEQDHYPMYLDVYDGIKLTDGSEINEVRFCQMPNSEPDTRDKQPLVNAVIIELEKLMQLGDTTVLDELLMKLPWEILKQSLPEELWNIFNNKS